MEDGHQSRPTILVVGSFRERIVNIFHQVSNNFEIIYLADENIAFSNADIKKIYLFSQFDNAFELITHFLPKTVFFIDYEKPYEVALLATCNELNIQTVHLEHGIRFPEILSLLISKENRQKNNQSLPSYLNAEFSEFTANKLSMYNMHHYLRNVKEFGIHNAWVREINKPKFDKYISFSPGVFEYHQLRNQLDSKTEVSYTGVIDFDEINFLNIKLSKVNSKNILFIDQPFYEQNWWGWTKEIKKNLISAIIESRNTKLFIKIHPDNESSFYESFGNKVELIHSEKQLLNTLPQIETVIGFYSTILLPLLSFNFQRILILHRHPDGSEIFSDELNSFGLVELFDFDSISSILDKQKNKKSKNLKMFIQKWMFKFDGEGKKRMVDSIDKIVSNNL